MKKIDNSVFFEEIKEKNLINLKFIDKYFAPYGIIQLTKVFFDVKNEDVEAIIKQMYEKLNEIKNNTSLNDYPMNMKLHIKKNKVILELVK